jgi:hypothetical protein
VLPFGWQSKDLDQATNLAASYGAPLEDALGIWFSESGLNWRNSNVGYYGLIMGLPSFVEQTAGMPPGAWQEIVTKESLTTQLLAIKRFWDAQIRLWLGAKAGQEEVVLKARATQLGVTPAGLLYSLNFVPAWAARAKTADGMLVRSADLGGGDPNAPDSEARYYKDNAPLDITKKGYISLRDMDLRISAFKARARDSIATRDLFTEGADIVPVGYMTSDHDLPISPPTKPSFSPWPAILGIGVIFGGIFVGLHYLEKAIPRS